MTTLSPQESSQLPSVDKIILCIVLWYVSSITITALNKLIFDSFHFDHPLLVTFIHFTLVGVLLRGSKASGLFPSLPKMPTLDPGQYWKYIVPISLFSTAEIALTNISYSMISIGAITVVKSSLVFVTYVFAVIAGLDRFSYRLVSVIFLIFGSIALSVPGMEAHDPIGLVYIGLAVCLAAVRWILIHHQLQYASISPIQLMYMVQPLSSIFLALPALFWDLLPLINKGIDFDKVEVSVSFILFLVIFQISIVFCLVFMEYTIVRYTSSVSLTVAGIGKEILTILMSMVWFHESLNLRQLLFILCSCIGIFIYSIIRSTISDKTSSLLGEDRDSLSTDYKQKGDISTTPIDDNSTDMDEDFDSSTPFVTLYNMPKKKTHGTLGHVIPTRVVDDVSNYVSSDEEEEDSIFQRTLLGRRHLFLGHKKSMGYDYLKPVGEMQICSENRVSQNTMSLDRDSPRGSRKISPFSDNIICVPVQYIGGRSNLPTVSHTVSHTVSQSASQPVSPEEAEVIGLMRRI